MKKRKRGNRAPKEMVKAQMEALSKVGIENVAVENGSVPNPHDG